MASKPASERSSGRGARPRNELRLSGEQIHQRARLSESECDPGSHFGRRQWLPEQRDAHTIGQASGPLDSMLDSLLLLLLLFSATASSQKLKPPFSAGSLNQFSLFLFLFVLLFFSNNSPPPSRSLRLAPCLPVCLSVRLSVRLSARLAVCELESPWPPPPPLVLQLLLLLLLLLLLPTRLLGLFCQI